MKRRTSGTGTITKRGQWYMITVTVFVAGERKTKSKSGFRTKAEAYAAAPALRDQLLGIRLADDDITLEQLYARWVPFYSPRVSEGRMKSNDAAFKWMAPLHSRVFRTLTTEHFQDVIDACPRKRRTKEDIKALASLLYKYAHDLKICSDNYAENLYCGSNDEQPRKALTPGQVERIAACGLPWSDYVLCLIYTGFRPGEMLALSKDSYVNGCLIGGSKTEAGRNRSVPVHFRIQPIIDRQLLTPGPWLFPRQDGRRMTDDYFRTYCFAPLMEALGIEGCVPYSCRHTFANMLKNVSGSDTDKAALMGHADASMTKYYQASDLTSRQEIIGRIM